MCWVSAIKICEKNPLGLLIFTIFLPIFSIFQCIPPVFTLMYPVKLILHTFAYNTELVITLELYLIMIYFVRADIIIHIWLFIPYLPQILGFRVTCGVKWCHYVMVEAYSHLNASHIHIRHIQSVWAHWYTVHGHAESALHCYTHPTWLRFWGSGSLVESKWCHYVMVEADSHFKLLPPSILNIYKVFEHIDMLSIGIW